MEKRRDAFQAIGDPTRRGILGLIAREPLTLNAIARHFAISRPGVSQQIKMLSECGLVTVAPRGRERYCYIRPEKIKEIDDWLAPFRQLWESRFNELDNVLAELKKGQL